MHNMYKTVCLYDNNLVLSSTVRQSENVPASRFVRASFDVIKFLADLGNGKIISFFF